MSTIFLSFLLSSLIAEVLTQSPLCYMNSHFRFGIAYNNFTVKFYYFVAVANCALKGLLP